MKMYRIKHIPTGLYFKPATGRIWSKTNLSKLGKVYAKKQPLPKGFYYRFDKSKDKPFHVPYNKANVGDFILEEVEFKKE